MIERKKVSDLKNWDKNPRSIDKKRFEQLKQSIKELGFNDVLKITKDGTVVGGNMRLRALQDLGIEEVDCIVVEAKNDQDIFKIALRDNEEFGYYDKEQLAELAFTLDLPKLELETYEVHLGSPTKLTDLLGQFGETEEDEPPEVIDDEPAVSKLGEIYQLGRHRVMCGDATDEEAINTLMDRTKANLLLTDPPYGVSYTDKNEFLNSIGKPIATPNAIENDHQTPEEMKVFWTDVFSKVFKFLDDDSSFYVCSPQGGELLLLLLLALRETGYPSRHMIIWSKNNHVLGRSDYNYKHEPLLYGWKKKHTFYGGGKQKTSVWEIAKPQSSKYHPTMKPLELMEECILNSSKIDDIVLDVFLGSGSTLIACEQTDRICYGMELDPKYVDVIRKRYWKFINDGNEEGWQEGTPVVSQ